MYADFQDHSRLLSVCRPSAPTLEKESQRSTCMKQMGDETGPAEASFIVGGFRYVMGNAREYLAAVRTQS